MNMAYNRCGDVFQWGVGEQFHSCFVDGKSFELFSRVIIETKEGETKNGVIGFIDDKSLSLILDDSNAKLTNISFESIQSMRC